MTEQEIKLRYAQGEQEKHIQSARILLLLLFVLILAILYTLR